MADVTGTFKTSAGTFTVAITDSFAAATAQVVDIGDIVYEFDITPDQTSISQIVALYSAVDIKLYLYDQFGNDLYDRFTNTTVNPVLITANFYDGTVGYYRFQHEPKDVTIDELTKIVTLKCQPWKLPTTMLDYFTNANYTANFVTYRNRATNGTAITYTAVSVGRFIFDILGELNAGTPTVTSSPTVTAIPARTPRTFEIFTPSNLTNVNNNVGAVLVNVQGLRDTNGTAINLAVIPAINVLAELAAAEGSIVGSGINPFYKWRLYSDEQKTLNYNELIDLKYQQTYQPLQFVFEVITNPKINTAATNINLPKYSASEDFLAVMNRQATKSLTLNLQPGYPMLSIGLISNTAAANVNGDPIVSTDSMDITFAGVQSYVSVFGGLDSLFDGSSSTSQKVVEGRVKGITRLAPYDTIVFGSDVPARYQNVNFRPTYLSYSFKADEIKFKAYSINS